jgi:hypothetical protein
VVCFLVSGGFVKFINEDPALVNQFESKIGVLIFVGFEPIVVATKPDYLGPSLLTMSPPGPRDMARFSSSLLVKFLEKPNYQSLLGSMYFSQESVKMCAVLQQKGGFLSPTRVTKETPAIIQDLDTHRFHVQQFECVCVCIYVCMYVCVCVCV